jgi:hypothetical protein
MVGTAVYQVGCKAATQSKEARGVKAGRRDHTRPGGESEDKTDATSPWMWNKRHDVQAPIGRSEGQRVTDVAGGGAQVPMGEGNHLRPRRGSGSMEHQRDVFRLRRCREECLRRALVDSLETEKPCRIFPFRSNFDDRNSARVGYFYGG